MRSRPLPLLALVAIATATATATAVGAQPPTLADALRDGIPFRNLGPFRAGSWITDVAVPAAPAAAHLYTFYVGARNGGVWKTTNNGTTFAPVFDATRVSSVGALAVAPSNANVVWVGTGDNSATRSANPGDGVFKSTDGGATWINVGLRDAQHVARIVVHPASPDTVWVAALGHLFTPNAERGVFRTTDGGRTWRKVLFVNDSTGAADLVIDPRDPRVLYAAMYEHRRFPWTLYDGGPGSGIFKSTDGGATWRKLGGGLPTGAVGRIGLDVFRADPRVLFAIVENRNPRPSTDEERRQDERRGLEPQERQSGGEVYRSDDAGATWRKVSGPTEDLSNKSGYAFNQIRVDPRDATRLFVTGSGLASSRDGGRTWGRDRRSGAAFASAFGDFRTLWIDPANPDRIIAGSDGGVFISYDGGVTNDHLYNLPLGEVYALTVDMEEPYNVYAGLQDHESWKGPSNGWSGRVGIAEWTTVGTGDGMYNQVDPTDSRWVYNTQEFGIHQRYDQRTRERTRIMPERPRGGGRPAYRFNWVTPLRLSPHDPKTLYTGAEVLLRSTDRGDTWEEISPDLTTNDPRKISVPRTTIQHCTITTIDESPSARGVIWVGTDDGKVQVTRDGGRTWTDATRALVHAGAPEDGWVTRVLASPHAPGTAWIAKSRHRMDDFRPLVYRTTDFGATWTAVTSGLPRRAVNALAEDPGRPGVLYAGTDAGVYASLDAGARWLPLTGTMPAVPVHDLLVHPRDGELVVGTYGRGIWIADVTPLRELSDSTVAAAAHLFAPRPYVRRVEGALGNYHLYGDRHLFTRNAPNGVTVTYALRAAGPARVTIADAAGRPVRTLEAGGGGVAGINRVVWDAMDAERRPVGPGTYTVTLEAGGRRLVRPVEVR